MAATHSLNSHTYDGRYLQVSLTQTKDAANRRSKITGKVTSLAGNSTWYATGPTTVTVAGTQRYSRARESSGTGQSNRNFVGTISEFYINHDTNGNASVSVAITTAIYASATQTTSNTWTLDSIGPATTACGAPTSLSLNPTVTETTSLLSWSGAKAGTNNTITAYEIQYSESTDNSSWGNWITGTTVNSTATSGSYAVTASGTRGNFRRYQIRTRGSAGASYYSGWKVSTNSVRRNKWPMPATSVTASPSIYSNETITLTWSGASGGTSTIKGYQVASRTSTNNSTWGSWDVLAIFDLAASSGSYHPTVTSVAGTYTQFGIWTIDAFGVFSSEAISNSIYCDITACLPPTSVSVSQTLAEGNISLTWSGAGNGAGNAIDGYEIQYSESSNGTTWGAWNALATIPSISTSGLTTVSPSSTRGNYRRFQIRTLGTAGSAYYSPWKGSSNSVRKNILPTPPVNFTASPTVYQSGNVTLTWSGTTAGTSAIKSYNIQKSTSGDGQVTWNSWEMAATVASGNTEGNIVVVPTNVAGVFTRYRLSVTDVLDGVTGYVFSNTVRKNTPPFAPTVFAPKPGSYTYNQTPMCLIETQPEPDGNPQTVYVLSSAGSWQNSVDNPEAFTTSGAVTRGIKTVYTNPATNKGQCKIDIQCRDAYSTGSIVSREFTILESPFEDIKVNETHVKASHIATLQTAVDNVRNYYNLNSYKWASEIVPGRTPVRDWPFHILELRAAIQGLIDRINSFDEAASENEVLPIAWIPIGSGRPRADVMKQLHDLILVL